MRERPTVLCLYGGLGFDHSTLKAFLTPLADIAQLVFLDQRGNGRSDQSTPDRWNLDTWIEDVREFSAALEIERPILLGQSFGGGPGCQATDLSVAQAVEAEREDLAGDCDLGDLLATPLGDSLVGAAQRSSAGSGVLGGLDELPTQRRRALAGDVTEAGLAVRTSARLGSVRPRRRGGGRSGKRVTSPTSAITSIAISRPMPRIWQSTST